jgi:hypothetical protein
MPEHTTGSLKRFWGVIKDAKEAVEIVGLLVSGGVGYLTYLKLDWVKQPLLLLAFAGIISWSVISRGRKLWEYILTKRL